MNLIGGNEKKVRKFLERIFSEKFLGGDLAW